MRVKKACGMGRWPDDRPASVAVLLRKRRSALEWNEWQGFRWKLWPVSTGRGGRICDGVRSKRKNARSRTWRKGGVIMRSLVGVVDQIVGDGGSQPQVLDAGHDRASGTFMRLGNHVSLLAGDDRAGEHGGVAFSRIDLVAGKEWGALGAGTQGVIEAQELSHGALELSSMG